MHQSHSLIGTAVVVLIDLVDERRGVWTFPNGSFLTNSVEAYRTGIDEWAPRQGARLIEFGTDEHFDLWRRGYSKIARLLMKRQIPVILLDIAWAEVAVGQRFPRGIRAVGGSVSRKMQRGSKTMYRRLVNGDSLLDAIKGFANSVPTKAGRLALEAYRQNKKYRRYIAFAETWASFTVHRTPAEVRMDATHKWGLSPYHYTEANYLDIAAEIRQRVRCN